MKTKKVISFDNLPVRLPIMPTITICLLLDRLNVSGIIWGIVGTLLVILWAACVVGVWNQQTTDIFKKP